LKPANQIDVLDQFAELWPLRKTYGEIYAKLQETQRRLSELSTNRTLREQQLELYRFQANEIDAAELDEAEFEELRARESVLSNLEKLKKDVGATHGALYETDGSILERLKMMAAVLSELSELDQNLKPIAVSVRDSTLQLEDAAFDMGRYLDKLDLDPSELAEVIDRLNTINRLVNKYGDPVSSTLSYRAEIAQKIAQLERATDDLSSLQADLDPLKRELTKLGGELSKSRRSAAKKLAPMIEAQLNELGMEKATFTVSITPTASASDTSHALASGFDQVEFIVQTNPGQTPQPLRKIASGGELSRIMLALKGILAQGDRVSVLVFDEIDANVGGRLGSIIGGKLRDLAKHHQVLCITHLPQIASYADRHLTVRKQSDDNQTRTTVRAITGDEQLEELSEMIGGQRITATTRAQAKELLDSAHSSPALPGKEKPPAKTRARRAV
jgi:DNA repair protein RecN (Recombination protein N)